MKRIAGLVVAAATFATVLVPPGALAGTDQSGMIDLGTLESLGSSGRVINENGQIAGTSNRATANPLPDSHVFLYEYDQGVMVDLGIDGASTRVEDMSDSGQIVGWTVSPDIHAFRYVNGVMQDINGGRVLSAAFAVNNSFVTVGEAIFSSGGVPHAFRHTTDEGMVDLGTLGGNYSAAVDINDAGQIIGSAELPSGNRVAFLFTSGLMFSLGTLGGDESHAVAINSSGMVIGKSENAAGQDRGFLFSNGVMTDLGTLGGTYSNAIAINDSGQVVGISETSIGEEHAYLYSGGVMTDLGTLGGAYSRPHAINSSGQVVGRSTTSIDTEHHPFFYSNTDMIDLGTFGGFFSVANDINDAGQIVGSSENEQGDSHAFLIACPVRPRDACEHGAKSSLSIFNGAGGDRDSFTWKWGGGASTVEQADLGDPSTDTTFTLCFYDGYAGDDHLVGTARILPGTPGGQSWTDRDPKGWSFRGDSATLGGIYKARLKTGPAGKAKVQVSAKGANTRLMTPVSPTRFFQQSNSVVVQMINDSTTACWSSAFTSALVNNGSQFSAKNP